MSCSTGNLELIADLPSSLDEASAIEIVEGSDLYWVIEDSGNGNDLYGLNTKGDIVKEIEISKSDNEDWEDLASDNYGTLYIGDFGNNNKKRTTFNIYKIPNVSEIKTATEASKVSFTLPKGMDSEDFEAFFVHNNWFYIFSKSPKKTKLIKVPNKEGMVEATFISEFNLEGKHTKITSADISNDGKTVALLNHDKVWLLSDFTGDDFFSGTFNAYDFEHDSQKEGVAFLSDTTLLITDERHKKEGGNIYTFKLPI